MPEKNLHLLKNHQINSSWDQYRCIRDNRHSKLDLLWYALLIIFSFLTIPCGSNPINLNLIWRNNCFPSVKQSSCNCLKNSSFNKTSIISNYAWPNNTKILGRDSIQFIKTVNLENCYCENGRLYIQIKIGQTKLTHVRKCKKESKLSLTSCCDK